MRLYKVSPQAPTYPLPDFSTLGDNLLFEKIGMVPYCPFRTGGECMTHPNGTLYLSNVAALVRGQRKGIACDSTVSLLRQLHPVGCLSAVHWVSECAVRRKLDLQRDTC